MADEQRIILFLDEFHHVGNLDGTVFPMFCTLQPKLQRSEKPSLDCCSCVFDIVGILWL